MKNLLKDRRAALGLVITLVTLGIILVVGLLVVSQLKVTSDALDLGATGNATRTSLFSNIYAAFNLAVIIPIVAGAGAIIGAVIAYFKVRGG